MTSQSPRIYTYKITFEEVPYYYYGVHKEKRYNEYYMGSPKTHKWCWEVYTPKKQILELFEYSDKGWIEALDIEKRLIKPIFNFDKWCLNESCGGRSSLEYCRRGGKISGRLNCENDNGFFSLTEEQKKENSKKGGKNGGKIGGKIGGKKIYENKIGVHGRTKEEMSEHGKMGGKISGRKTYELGIGCHSLTPEEKTKASKKGGEIVSSQRWKCLETGFITNPGNLSKYQKSRGIDTSNRIRIL